MAEIKEEELNEVSGGYGGMMPFQPYNCQVTGYYWGTTFMGGGPNEFTKWVNERLVYPEIAKENGVQGRVTLQFTVEKDGSVTNVKVLRGIGGGCDEEAIRVVKAMPKWKPGKQHGKAVRVSYLLPINFQVN